MKAVSSYINSWLKCLNAKGYAQSTVRTYDERFRHVHSYLTRHGLKDLRKVKRTDLEACLAELKDSGTQSLHSLGTIVRATRSFFGYLESSGVLLKSPAASLSEPNTKGLLPRNVLTTAETKALLDQPEENTPTGFRDKTCLQVMVGCGLRSDEVVQLTLADVDLENGLLLIQGKGKRQRHAVLPKQAAEYLRRYIEVVREKLCRGLNPNRKPKSLPNLWVNRCGNPYKGYMLCWMVSEYAKAARIKKRITPHSLRHTFATSLAQRNCPQSILSDLMGHTALKSTARYIRYAALDPKAQHEQKHPLNRRKDTDREAEPRLRGRQNAKPRRRLS